MRELNSVLLATALGGLLLAPATALAQTTVTMWTFLDLSKSDPRSDTLNMMIENFEAANPDIELDVQPQDFATMPPRFFLGHQQGRNPDVVCRWLRVIFKVDYFDPTMFFHSDDPADPRKTRRVMTIGLLPVFRTRS